MLHIHVIADFEGASSHGVVLVESGLLDDPVTGPVELLGDVLHGLHLHVVHLRIKSTYILH